MNSACTPPPRDRGCHRRRRPVLRRASALAAVALAAVLLPTVATAPAGAQSSASLSVTPSEIERPTAGDKPVTLSLSHSGCSGCWVELDPGWDSPAANQAVKGKNADFGAANRWATAKTINGKAGKGAVPASFGIKVRPGNLLPSFIRFTLNDGSGVRAEAKVWLNTPGLVVNNQEPQQSDPQQQEPEYSLATEQLCVSQLRTPTSAVQKAHAVWSPGCRGQELYDRNHSSRYFVVNSGSSGALSLVVESCTAVRLTLRGYTATTGPTHSSASSPYEVYRSRDGKMAWAPFTRVQGVTALRHQKTSTGANNSASLDRWPRLTPNTTYTVEVAARYAGQLGEFTLSFSNSDTGFTATPGRCSTTSDSGTLKPPRRSFSCVGDFHKCLGEADPQFWNNDAGRYGGQRRIRSGDFSRFPNPTGAVT